MLHESSSYWSCWCPEGLLTLGQLLASLVIIYVSKIGGELALRLKQPAVLGELVAGLAVGVSGFRLVNPESSH